MVPLQFSHLSFMLAVYGKSLRQLCDSHFPTLPRGQVQFCVRWAGEHLLGGFLPTLHNSHKSSAEVYNECSGQFTFKEHLLLWTQLILPVQPGSRSRSQYHCAVKKLWFADSKALAQGQQWEVELGLNEASQTPSPLTLATVLACLSEYWPIS